jgi:predicted RNase H-like nuclease (RuvC/YqgF family)
MINTKERRLDVFPGTWAEYVEARDREVQTPESRVSRDRRIEHQRQTRRNEQRARRQEEAFQQRVAELETEIHRLEREMSGLEEEIAAASVAQQAIRVAELGVIYAELEARLRDKWDYWAELAG